MEDKGHYDENMDTLLRVRVAPLRQRLCGFLGVDCTPLRDRRTDPQRRRFNRGFSDRMHSRRVSPRRRMQRSRLRFLFRNLQLCIR